MTYITPTKNLYNRGKCFTKGKIYVIPQDIEQASNLTGVKLVNDLGKFHIIGSWWQDFVIVTDKHKI